jgi:hypothetical protein
VDDKAAYYGTPPGWIGLALGKPEKCASALNLKGTQATPLHR